MADKPVCKIENCDNPSKTRGLCDGHYWRLRKHGDPMAGRLSKGACKRWLAEAIEWETENCIIWPFKALVKGYPVLTFGTKVLKVSRIVCEREHGPAPTIFHVAAHSCRTPACINRKHIRWATHRENSQDMIDHGTVVRGSAVVISKLKETDIPEIRALLADGKTRKSIGQMYGVTDVAISAIATGRTWSHI